MKKKISKTTVSLIQQKSKFLNIGGQQTHFDTVSVKKHLTPGQIIELSLVLQSIESLHFYNCKSSSSEDDNHCTYFASSDLSYLSRTFKGFLSYSMVL